VRLPETPAFPCVACLFLPASLRELIVERLHRSYEDVARAGDVGRPARARDGRRYSHERSAPCQLGADGG
jgi:hypothetical protein